MSGKSRFRPKTRRYELNWPEDHDLHGLQVTLRAMRLGELTSLAKLYQEFKGTEDNRDEADAAKGLQVLNRMVARLAEVLVSWNRMDEDTMKWNEETEEFEETEDTQILPADGEGLSRLEDWEFMAIFEGYMTAAVGVTTELGKGLNSGSTSLAELPTTDL